jgi:hypothetical protein
MPGAWESWFGTKHLKSLDMSRAVLPKRGSEAGAGAGSGSAGAHFSKNGRERSVSGAFIYIYIYKIYIYIQKNTCRMPNMMQNL